MERDLRKASTIMASMHLKVPFVVTIAAAAAACGGTAVVESGSGGSSSGNTTATTSGQTTATTGTGNTLECPASPPDGYTQCDPGPGVCTYDVACQSGTVALSFTCAEGWWEIQPTACEQPYDSCPGTEYYCNGEWIMPQGTNPPSPCPDTAPLAGEPCFSGGMGGVWENCGYYCGPQAGSAWTVASCPFDDPESVWQYDGVCEGGG